MLEGGPSQKYMNVRYLRRGLPGPHSGEIVAPGADLKCPPVDPRWAGANYLTWTTRTSLLASTVPSALGARAW